MGIAQDGRQIFTRIEPDKAERLERLAKENQRTMAAELRLAVDEYLLEHDPPKQPWLTSRLKRA